MQDWRANARDRDKIDLGGRSAQTADLADINDLMATLRLNPTEELAAVLRSPGDSYPSYGLVRTYRNCTALPSARFIDLLHQRRIEVEEQITRGGIQAPRTPGHDVRVYEVTPKRHLITIISSAEIRGADLEALDSPDRWQEAVAALAVPSEWVGYCAICGLPFIHRTSNAKYCYRRDAEGHFVCREAAAVRRWKRPLESGWFTRAAKRP